MQNLADHLLLIPGEDCALGFTNDGECFLYAAAPKSIDRMRRSFQAFGEAVKELSPS
jgi:hypothetical protein